MKKVLFAVLVLIILSACSQTQVQRNPSFEPAVNSILVLPVANNSINVNAATSALSTLPVVLAERGYYVFPVNTVKVVLEQEGLYTAGEIHALTPRNITNMFDADSVLYVTVKKWDAQYVVVQTQTIVEIEYKLVNPYGETLWQSEQRISTATQNSNSGNALADLIAEAISASVERAWPKYMDLLKQANRNAFVTGSNPLPKGPYGQTPQP